ncbi:MAG: dihydroneopterin aldolase [Pseudomonadota bacterium]
MSVSSPETARQRTVFVENLVLDAFIGVYEFELGGAQPVRIDIDVDVSVPGDPLSDEFEDAMCYGKLTEAVKAIIAEGHIKLVETLAERIADYAIGHPMALGVRVRVSKPRAIEEATAAGVVVTRKRAYSAAE